MTYPDLPPDFQRWAERVRPTRGWTAPVSTIVRRLLDLATEPSQPVVAEAALVSAHTDGVRTVSAPAREADRWITRVFPDGELGIRIEDSPEGFGKIIRGRVWLSDGAHCRVLLLQDDHVLAMARSGPEVEFRFEEFLTPESALEIHPESGRAWRFEGLS